ncbi:9845_t:CDS:1, partial [Gigaspora rosea]
MKVVDIINREEYEKMQIIKERLGHMIYSTRLMKEVKETKLRIEHKERTKEDSKSAVLRTEIQMN